jgi:hypothetical protein
MARYNLVPCECGHDKIEHSRKILRHSCYVRIYGVCEVHTNDGKVCRCNKYQRVKLIDSLLQDQESIL